MSRAQALNYSWLDPNSRNQATDLGGYKFSSTATVKSLTLNRAAIPKSSRFRDTVSSPPDFGTIMRVTVPESQNSKVLHLLFKVK